MIGKRKMMAVPTHLFKIIFLEFTNENENDEKKKTYWLETLVVSNGQDQDEDEEGNTEENEEGRKEQYIEELGMEEEEEREDIIVQIEMGNNIWYNLDKDETEIEQMLKVGSKEYHFNKKKYI